ncbi:MAG: hypothetical protein NZL89_02370 [Leptospiraceae bacterium]|nr:hypothetical protein [Leptospiraceae bacterium]
MVARCLVLLFIPAAALAFGEKVVRFQRSGEQVLLSVAAGYGVQRDGRHELIFTESLTGKVVKKVQSLHGKVARQDPKYFESLEPIAVPGTGRLHVTGRIFYCSFRQKFCSVQRVDEEI